MGNVATKETTSGNLPSVVSSVSAEETQGAVGAGAETARDTMEGNEKSAAKKTKKPPVAKKGTKMHVMVRSLTGGKYRRAGQEFGNVAREIVLNEDEFDSLLAIFIEDKNLEVIEKGK